MEVDIDHKQKYEVKIDKLKAKIRAELDKYDATINALKPQAKFAFI